MKIRTIKSNRLPFTLPGLALFVISLVILVRSLVARNAYEIVLSVAALAIWVVLWLTGTWAVRRLGAFEPVWKIPLPLGAASARAEVATAKTARAGSAPADSAADWLVTSPTEKIPWFFRLHFFVKGRFFPQGSSSPCPVFAETSLSRKGAAGKRVTAGNFARGNLVQSNGFAHLRLSFPLGGSFRGETSCRLRDIFGFFSFPCGNNRERTVNVRSAPCGTRALRIDAQSGAEDRRNKSSSDEERYYMREYAPGDRLRDINWKSSERIDTLITRISPDNQEKITRIQVYFRNYGPSSSGIPELWLLDRAKARLAWFLRKVKEEKSSYVFQVTSAAQSWDLNTDEDIDAFLEELAAIPFFPAQNDVSVLPTEGELYVFSTACDTALPAFLAAQQGRPMSLFFTQTSSRENPKRECLMLRNFFIGGVMPLPRWLLPRRLFYGRKPQMGVNMGRMIIDYAETRL